MHRSIDCISKLQIKKDNILDKYFRDIGEDKTRILVMLLLLLFFSLRLLLMFLFCGVDMSLDCLLSIVVKKAFNDSNWLDLFLAMKMVSSIFV
mgnify:FL=1